MNCSTHLQVTVRTIERRRRRWRRRRPVDDESSGLSWRPCAAANPITHLLPPGPRPPPASPATSSVLSKTLHYKLSRGFQGLASSLRRRFPWGLVTLVATSSCRLNGPEVARALPFQKESRLMMGQPCLFSDRGRGILHCHSHTLERFFS